MSKKIQKSRQLYQLKLFALSLLAGGCLAVPFLYYKLGWVSLVALLPFLYMLSQFDKHQLSRRSQVGYIWLSGWVMLLGTTHWLLQTQPERWATLSGWWAISGLVLTYMLFSLILSTGFVLLGMLYVLLRLDLKQKRIFGLLPAIWVLAEWVRSWVFSIISLGPNTTIGPHWNFGDLGFAASVTPLVFLGRWGGLYALSFAVVLINLSFFWLLRRRWKLPLVVLTAIVLLSSAGYLVYSSANGKSVRTAALQLGNNESLDIGAIDFHQKLGSLAAPKSIDVLVLSEYSDVFNDQSKPTDTQTMQAILRDNNVPIITSRQRSDSDHMYNTVTVYRSDGRIAYDHDKQFLVPVGEAMPYAYIYLFRLLGQGQAIDANQSGREISRGTEPAQAYRLDGLRLGSMACSGAISPELYRGLVFEGAQILTNSASLSIFIKAPSYHEQAQQMARFMAVSNARPFVQATDGSYSFVIDHNGRWLQKSSQKNLQLLQQSVTTNARRTPYSILGEWVVVASAMVVVGQIIALCRSKR